MNGHPGVHSDTHIIEEEPAHEIYARICGIQLSSTQSRRNRAITVLPIHEIATSFHHSRDIDLIVSEKSDALCGDERQYDHRHSCKSVFGKALAYASTEVPSTQTNKLTFDKSNKGFQLLKKLGFHEEDGGLGKMRQGRLSPIEIKRKIDKRGLGVPGGERNISSSMVMSPREKKRSKVKHKVSNECHQIDKQKERMVRSLLRTDVSIEHEDIFLTLMHY